MSNDLMIIDEKKDALVEETVTGNIEFKEIR